MKLAYLRRWQATHLAERLSKLDNFKTSWSTLSPALQFSSRARGTYDPSTGTFDSQAKALGTTRARRPQYLDIRVGELPECGIPEHHIYMMRSDYEEALAEMPPHLKEAWGDYLRKPRSSAIYAPKRTREGGKVYRSPQRVTSCSRTLERAVLFLLKYADVKDPALLEELHKQRLERESGETLSRSVA